MSTTMDQIHHIRDMFYRQDKNISEIASETGLNWKTVKKYVDMEDFNNPSPKPASSEVHESKLDPFKPLIDEWLQADKLAPRKQRHTAKRVFKRLKDEADGFGCSYRLVALYVKQKKEELRLKRTDGYIPLNHHPGEAQSDFGTADFYENDRLHHEAKYLVLSFPYSNGGFLQLNYGENMECLLERCEIDMQREHYDDDDDRFISKLFEEDKARLLPLPSVPFDTALYTTATTDKYGKFTLDAGKHRYSASPAFCESIVNLKITSSDVIVMDKDMHEVVRHKRLYGNEHERMDWLPYLTYIARKPRSLRNSGIYDMMPQTMQIYMDNCESKERGRVLKVLAELTERTGFASAVRTVDEAVRLNATDPDSLQSLYRRTYADVPLLPPLENKVLLPQQKVIPFRNDLKMLDAALKKGGVSNG